jgi:hypothetical protein
MLLNDSLIEVHAIKFKKCDKIFSDVLEHFVFRKTNQLFTKECKSRKSLELEFIKDIVGFRFTIIGENPSVPYSSGMDYECLKNGFENILNEYFDIFEKITIKLLDEIKKEESVEALIKEMTESVRFIVLFGYGENNSGDEPNTKYDLKGIFHLHDLTLESIENFLIK